MIYESNTSMSIQYRADSREINLETQTRRRRRTYKMEEQWVLQRRDSRYFGILLRQRRVNGPESIGLAHRRAKRVWWKLKPLDGIGRAVKYCLLHPPTRLPLPTLFLSSTLFEHLRFGEDSPFQTKPEVKRRRVYFTSPSPYLPLLSLFTSPIYPPRSIVSTLFSIRCRFHHHVSVSVPSFCRIIRHFYPAKFQSFANRIAWMES